jgi:hypothetical protein
LEKLRWVSEIDPARRSLGHNAGEYAIGPFAVGNG